MKMMDYFPKRIICLTEESTETLYLLGEESRISGISVYTVRPASARKEKPRISAFTEAKIDRILELKPDLVIGYSDVQSKIAEELIKNGITVWINNHRSIEGILSMITQLGGMVGKREEAENLISVLQSKLNSIEASMKKISRPRVYFEEWPEPMIAGSLWVSELIDIAGGKDIFSDKSTRTKAKDRMVSSEEVIEKNPDIIIASWCGKKLNKNSILTRENWSSIQAVKREHIFEIDSSLILQPGPACILEGIDKIIDILDAWRRDSHI